ncbi:MAG: nucleotidyltransferase family protein [Chloroflexota bacterium]|nr:nucleotidyltransferase family protein [Chloroflexota bacterium]
MTLQAKTITPSDAHFGIDDVIGDKRDAILALAQQYGAYNVRIFGSVARGQARPTSDIDFLVDWDYERVSAWGSGELRDELQTLLGRAIDIVSAKWLDPPLSEQILREAVVL